MDLSSLCTLFEQCAEEQHRLTAGWHEVDPPMPRDHHQEGGPTGEGFKELAMAQHLINFTLWHVEDRARRKDVDDSVIAGCKREIDGLNQRRNDHIERMDAFLVALLRPLMPEDAGERYNTETLGSVLDRLSILSLKRFHMQEQVERDDVDQSHRDECRAKVRVLEEQYRDLVRGGVELLRDYGEGRKKPKIYRQYKMYNDPSLNPELYGTGK